MKRAHLPPPGIFDFTAPTAILIEGDIRMEGETKQHPVAKFFDRLFVIVDDAILVAVAIGVMAVAVILLVEAGTDIYYFSAHSIAHIISDMMFVLIIMELVRQVVRQVKRHEFNLNPFIFIGVIASIRGLLLTQMRIGMGEVEWNEGILLLIANSFIVLILVICYLIYAKARRWEKERE